MDPGRSADEDYVAGRAAWRPRQQHPRGARGNSIHAMPLRQRHQHTRARGNSTQAVPLHQRHRHARAGGRQHARARGRAGSKLLLLVVVDGLELEQVLVALHGSLLILGEELLGTLGE